MIRPGRGALPLVAASAYLSCFPDAQRVHGVQHDYTRKQGLVWQAVFLSANGTPGMAGPGEALERRGGDGETKDSRLAREFVAALAHRAVTGAAGCALCRSFVREQFVGRRGCAPYVAIHDTDGHNSPRPHFADGTPADRRRAYGSTRRRRSTFV